VKIPEVNPANRILAERRREAGRGYSDSAESVRIARYTAPSANHSSSKSRFPPKQYDTPLNKGIPALAVLESDGKVVVSQKNGEFEDARSLTPEALLEFLNKWELQAR
jgi:hypothetical protein